MDGRSARRRQSYLVALRGRSSCLRSLLRLLRMKRAARRQSLKRTCRMVEVSQAVVIGVVLVCQGTSADKGLLLARIKEAIEAASSMEEVTKLEKALRTGNLAGLVHAHLSACPGEIPPEIEARLSSSSPSTATATMSKSVV